MADYIYLLEQRLSAAQRAALASVRGVATESGLTLFLVGGAVRDLTSGSPVRDLDFLVQGNAFTLRPQLEAVGAQVTGVQDELQTLYLTLPGAVRAELGSTLSANYPKPARPIFQPSSLAEDLRRRDFTANAMALSLNQGSYGLLIDPLNGVADIENRQLRLVSNYGFIEEPVRLVRAARFMARLGWTLEEKTQTRYETAKAEGYITALNDFQRGYELEEILHEEDPLRILRRLETEGWMKVLAPFWTPSRISAQDLERLRDTQNQLHEQGIHADGAAAAFPLLTAKFSDSELTALKADLPRRGFVAEVEGLEAETKEFVARLISKTAATPSAAWKIITSARSEPVLQAAFGSKSPAVQARFHSFLTEWPQARQRIPYALMQEMRISPEMDRYAALVETLFFALIDGQLTTPEETRAFLEPYSPPAPPPPVNLKRTRAAKKDGKAARSKAKKVLSDEVDQDSVELDEDLPADAVATADEADTEEEEEAARDAIRALKQVGAENDEEDEPETEVAVPEEAQSVEEETAAVPEAEAAQRAAEPSPVELATQPVKTSHPAKKTTAAEPALGSSEPSKATGKSEARPASTRKPQKHAAPSPQAKAAATKAKGTPAVVQPPSKSVGKGAGKTVGKVAAVGPSAATKSSKVLRQDPKVEASASSRRAPVPAKKKSTAPAKKVVATVAGKAETKAGRSTRAR